MTKKTEDKVELTIVIPHYKTLELTKLCLRSLRKFTDIDRIRTIVIDNGSQDDSTEYLKTVKWIDLVERECEPGESGSLAHARALNLGLEMTTSPYMLSIHTDTIVCSDNWLTLLLANIKDNPNVAGVGSWKLEHKTKLKIFFKMIESWWQTKISFPLRGKGEGNIEGRGKNYYYLRSHCALYRTELLKKYTDGFADGDETAGKVLHKKLVDAGFQMNFMTSHQLASNIKHLNHATMILNPDKSGKKTGTKKEARRLMRELKSVKFNEMLEENSLDK